MADSLTRRLARLEAAASDACPSPGVVLLPRLDAPGWTDKDGAIYLTEAEVRAAFPGRTLVFCQAIDARREPSA